jgi:hypothetical protein
MERVSDLVQQCSLRLRQSMHGRGAASSGERSVIPCPPADQEHAFFGFDRPGRKNGGNPFEEV